MIGRLTFRLDSLNLLAALGIAAVVGCGGSTDSTRVPPPSLNEPVRMAKPVVPPGSDLPARSESAEVAVSEEPAATTNEPVHKSEEGPNGGPSEDKPPAELAIPQSIENPATEEPGKEPFVGWPDPSVALFITGQQHGYIEPCGCTGLVNQKGGMSRRHTLARQLLDRGWTLVPLDAGNQVRRFGRQAEIKFQITVEGMKRYIGYRAIALGGDDLRLSALELASVTAPTDDGGTPFLCANATIIDPMVTPPYRIVEAGGKKIGITAVLGNSLHENINSDEIILKSAEDGLQEVVGPLEQQACDLYVLLAHTSIEDSKHLAQQFPLFDVVVTAGGLGDPTFQPEPVPGTDAIMIQVGIKGMFVGVLGLFDDREKPLRYERVSLDARFKDSQEMLELLASYQDELKGPGLEGLGIRPIPHPGGKTFAGSESCNECHSYEYEVWEGTPHAHALDSLIHPGERSEIPRHFDPECISCHVVGWNAQKFFPYTSGYLGVEKTPLMHNVGCESCHGPGAQHAAAENGDVELSDEEIDALRLAVSLPLESAEKKCMECHDLDNSPGFHEEGAFTEFWEQVEH